MEKSKLHGIEIDPISGRIAKQLYQKASGLALSIVPLEVMNITTPPARTLSRAFAIK